MWSKQNNKLAVRWLLSKKLWLFCWKHGCPLEVFLVFVELLVTVLNKWVSWRSTGKTRLRFSPKWHKWRPASSNVVEKNMDNKLSTNLQHTQAWIDQHGITITRLWIAVISSKWYIYKNLHRTPWIFTISQDRITPVPVSRSSRLNQSTVMFYLLHSRAMALQMPTSL